MGRKKKFLIEVIGYRQENIRRYATARAAVVSNTEEMIELIDRIKVRWKDNDGRSENCIKLGGVLCSINNNGRSDNDGEVDEYSMKDIGENLGNINVYSSIGDMREKFLCDPCCMYICGSNVSDYADTEFIPQMRDVAVSICMIGPCARQTQDLVREKAPGGRYLVISKEFIDQHSDVLEQRIIDNGNSVSKLIKLLSNMSGERRGIPTIGNNENNVTSLISTAAREVEKILCKLKRFHREEDEEFLGCAYSMLLLMINSCFTMDEYDEYCRLRPTLRVKPAKLRMDELRSLCGNDENKAEAVREVEKIYGVLKTENPKRNELIELCRQNNGKSIQVFVRKKNYEDLIKNILERALERYDIQILTPKQFKAKDHMNLSDVSIITGTLKDETSKTRVFSGGELEGKTDIKWLCYEYEKGRIDSSRRKEGELRYNINRLATSPAISLSNSQSDGVPANNDDEVIVEIEEIVHKRELQERERQESQERERQEKRERERQERENQDREYLRKCNVRGGYESEVVRCLSFEGCEKKAYISKYAKIFVYRQDSDQGANIKELSAEEINVGDIIIFNRHNQDVVSYFVNLKIEKGEIQREIWDNSRRWRENLNGYRARCSNERNGDFNRRIASFFSERGERIDPRTIGEWLDPDNHIVGPRRGEAHLMIIGELCGDEAMEDKPEVYANAIRSMRSIRTKVLKTLADRVREAIARGIVNEQISQLVEIYVVENISEISERTRVIVNRPI